MLNRGTLIALAIFTLGMFISLYFIAFAAYNQANTVETQIRTVENVINRTIVIKGTQGPRGATGATGAKGQTVTVPCVRHVTC